MARWGLIDAVAREAVGAIYRPDIYAEALGPVGAAIPLSDEKPEGGHARAWSVPATPESITMESDLFCDGAVF